MTFGRAAHEVVGYVSEDGEVCLDCWEGRPGKVPVFLGDEGANAQCVDCGDGLSGEEPEHLVEARRRAEVDAIEAEIAEEEARVERGHNEALDEAEEELKELEAMKRKVELKLLMLKERNQVG